VEISPAVQITAFVAFGLVVGSFLNVAIHRLPLEGESVSRPRRSRCPSCRRELSWSDNVPIVSWVLLRGRCRACSWRIPVRYPLVEALTAALWGLAAWLAPEGAWDLALVQVVVLSGLVVSTFVDFDHFEIPDEVSIGGMVLAPLASLLVPALHSETWLAQQLSEGEGVDRMGALLGSLAGLLAGGGVLWLLGRLGSRLFGRDAMGFGDVKLLAAGGGFVGPGGALAALLVGTVVASVAGLANMLRFYVLTRTRARRRGATQSVGHAVRVARIAGRYLPFGPYLGIGIGIVLLDWNHVVELWKGLAF
jgi:leader peptidase (prepilin peptidase)/N-methyltransferase